MDSNGDLIALLLSVEELTPEEPSMVAFLTTGTWSCLHCATLVSRSTDCQFREFGGRSTRYRRAVLRCRSF